MIRISGKRAEFTARGVTLALVLVLAASGLSASTHAEDDVLVVEYGTDIAFTPSAFNYAFTPFCGPTGVTCGADAVTGDAWATAHAEDGAVAEGESLVGVRYFLQRACDGQDLSAGFTTAFAFAFDVAASTTGAASADASVRLRARSVDEAPVDAARVVTGNDSGTGTWTSPTIFPANGTTYAATLGAFASASTTDVAHAADVADASAAGVLESVRLEFGDDAPPVTDVTVASAVEPAGGAGAFLGWYAAPVHVHAAAQDPSVSADGATVASSCVADVTIEDAHGEWSASYDPGFTQDPVVHAVTADGRHVVTARATDRQGNAEADPPVVDFGVDTRAPAVPVTLAPAAPNGNDGWYRAPPPGGGAVIVRAQCEDANGLPAGAYSGCARLHWAFNEDAFTSAPSDEVILTPPDGVNVTFRAFGVDVAGNVAPESVLGPIGVDLTAPQLLVDASPPALFGNDWYRSPVTLAFYCTDATSGCRGVRVDDGALESSPSRSFCESEGTFDVTASAEDVAGNARNATVPVGCDFTPPSPLVGLTLMTPVHEFESQSFVNATPQWAWDPSVDAVSGVRHYDVTVDDAHVALVMAPAFDGTGFPDGDHCVGVTPVDEAGNHGGDGTDCVFVDRVAPTTAFTRPLAGYLYDNGRAVPIPGGATVVVGDIDVILEGADVGAAPSGMRRLAIHDALGNADEPVRDCAWGGVTACHWTDDGNGASVGVAHRALRGSAWDRALNHASAERDYTRVQVAVVEAACETATPCGRVYWEAADALGFVAYEVHRAQDARFVPSPDTRVASIGDAGVTRYLDEDPDLVTGTDYYYAVVAVTTQGDVVTHESRIAYDGDAGDVGSPVACTPFTCPDA